LAIILKKVLIKTAHACDVNASENGHEVLKTTLGAADSTGLTNKKR